MTVRVFAVVSALRVVEIEAVEFRRGREVRVRKPEFLVRPGDEAGGQRGDAIVLVGGGGGGGVVMAIPAEQTGHEGRGQGCRAEDLVQVLRGVQLEGFERDVA